MQKPIIPENEMARLSALKEYNLLDTLPEKDFDDITMLASHICDTPISTITLIDTNRQFFKSHHGLTNNETPRDYAFCAHAINDPDKIFIVSDSTKDQRFFDNPLVTGEPKVIFYAGIPLVTTDGFSLGTLCVIDNKPRNLSEAQLNALKALSNQVMRLLELKRNHSLLHEEHEEKVKAIELFDQTGKIARVGGWEIDLVNKKRSWSNVTKEILEVPKNYDPEYKVTIDFYEDDETRERVTKLVNEAIEHNVSFDTTFKIITAKGNKRWVRSRGNGEFVDGNCIRLYGIFQDISADKIKDQLLSQKQHELQNLVELYLQTSRVAKVGGWEVDLINNILTWTSVTKEIHEVPQDYVPDLEKGINFYKEGESRNKIISHINKAFETGAPFDEELQIITAKGNERWVRSKGNAEFVNGKCVRMYGIIQDIHEQKLKDIQLQQSEELFRETLNNAPIGLSIINLEGKWVQVNQALCNILGYSKEELLKTNYKALTHPEDLVEELHYVNALLKDEIKSYQIEKRYQRKNQTMVWVLRSVSLIRDAEGKPSYFIAHTMDISQRRKAEQVIKDERKLLRTLINNIPVNIFIKDLNSRKTLVNQKEIEYAGFRNERDILGKSDYDLYPKDTADISVAEDKAIIDSGESIIDKETFSLKYDGSTHWFLTSKIPLRNENDVITGLLGVSYDISERKKAEEVLKELMDATSEQNMRLLNFAHIVSHNLRTYSGNFSLLLNDLIEESDENNKALTIQMLQKASENLKETVAHLNEIVEINTRVSQDSHVVNLHDEIEKVKDNVKVLLANSKVEVINEVDPSINFSGVPAYIESIFLNFITNGIKYKANIEKPFVKFTSAIIDKAVLITVQDNGIGIDMNKFGEKLFGMYKTFHGNKDAKGIGLFITKNQIEAMGGKIEVESEVGKGTTFHITFFNK